MSQIYVNSYYALLYALYFTLHNIYCGMIYTLVYKHNAIGIWIIYNTVNTDDNSLAKCLRINLQTHSSAYPLLLLKLYYITYYSKWLLSMLDTTNTNILVSYVYVWILVGRTLLSDWCIHRHHIDIGLAT